MTSDQRADRVAARQHGLLTHSNARSAGLTERQIAHRIGTRRWDRVARGLYRVNSAPLTAHQRLLTAVLAGPVGAVASHVSAAWLLGALTLAPTPHVLVPVGTSARGVPAVVHRGDLGAGERTKRWGIPVTAGVRTAVDCAALLPAERLANVVDTLIFDGLTTAVRIERAMAARDARACPGAAALRQVLRAWIVAIEPGSPAEVRLLRHLARWGFPGPVTQYEVRSRVRDLRGSPRPGVA